MTFLISLCQLIGLLITNVCTFRNKPQGFSSGQTANPLGLFADHSNLGFIADNITKTSCFFGSRGRGIYLDEGEAICGPLFVGSRRVICSIIEYIPFEISTDQ